MPHGEFKYDQKDGWQGFRVWLVKNHASLLPPTSEWEIYRAETNLGMIVGYRNKMGKANHPVIVHKLLETFEKRQPVPSLARTEPKKKYHGSKQAKRILALMNRDGERCFYCGLHLRRPYAPGDAQASRPIPTVEHFLSTAKGGPDNIHNCLIACKECNGEADSMSIVQKIEFRNRKRANGQG